MCGITGLISKKGYVEPQWIEAMNDSMKHRGPDDEGFIGINKAGITEYIGKDSIVKGKMITDAGKNTRLFLGHRRLSIIDVSPAGHQPMSFNNDRYWLIFNGEIYNYVEIKAELSAKGYEFKSHSDSESILAAYQEWGTDCVSRFNGMWSFCIFDREKNILFGSRDRFGVKPFYYIHNDDYFAFASEIKSLLTLPAYTREINKNAVFEYLVLGREDSREEGFFKNIFELFPSQSFTFDLNTNEFKKWQYYELKYETQFEAYNESKAADYTQQVRELIFKAVELRLRSDVSIGSCLSGGLDSSTVVCTINDMMKKADISQVGAIQKVFTACFDGEKIDESNWAKMVVDQTKTDWLRTYPKSDEMMNDMEDMIAYQDIPFGSTSIYAQYRVMKLVKESGVTVLMDGQGSDELFAGYGPYFRAFFAEMILKGNWKMLKNEWKNLSNSPISRKYVFNSVFSVFGAKVLPRGFQQLYMRFSEKKNRYINPKFWKDNMSEVEDIRPRAMTSLNQMLHKTISQMGLKSLLRYEDRNSMRFSIEARTPFADDLPLIETLFSVPGSYKIHNGWTKKLLRDAMEGIIPKPIQWRRDKLGFVTPEKNWMEQVKQPLKEYITADLEEYIDVQSTIRDWNRLVTISGRMSGTEVWRLLNFAIWKKVYRI